MEPTLAESSISIGIIASALEYISAGKWQILLAFLHTKLNLK